MPLGKVRATRKDFMSTFDDAMEESSLGRPEMPSEVQKWS